mmetsp:Transcript_5764/g.18358  ORF Transcript_5764/g.18358 Transcript_5764/m.18358 type:complete len:119 (+) Transcript_5764:248-604(+)|eukprot:scaffold3913_cov101-Isochrysis_galbana.AAC.3
MVSDVTDGVRQEIVSFEADAVVAHSAAADILNAILPELQHVSTIVTFGRHPVHITNSGDKRMLCLVGDADELVHNTDGCTVVPHCGHMNLLDEQQWHSALSRQAQLTTKMKYDEKAKI